MEDSMKGDFLVKLDEDELREKLLNELKVCRAMTSHKIVLKDELMASFPLDMEVTFFNVKAPIPEGKNIRWVRSHTFLVSISADYPYEHPSIKWLTPIFHPNIMMPQDGGRVYPRLGQTWTPKSNLLDFFNEVEELLVNPEPEEAFSTKTCRIAAKYFRSKM